MKDYKTNIIFIFSFLIVMAIWLCNWDIVIFKRAITKTKSIEISALYQNDEIAKTINNPEVVNKFVEIFSSVSPKSGPTMSVFSNYKFNLLDKNKKIVADITCVSSINIKDVQSNLYLDNDKKDELLKLIAYVTSKDYEVENEDVRY